MRTTTISARQRAPGAHPLPGAARPRAPARRLAARPDALADLARCSARGQAQAGLMQLVHASARVRAQGRMCALAAQGRRPPAQPVALNDSAALEQEADRMGARAAAIGRAGPGAATAAPRPAPAAAVLQGFWLRRHGAPEWINNARKVDAILAPEAAPGPMAGAASQAPGATVYRLAPPIQAPWEALGRLISALGAAKVQAIEVRGYPLWGTAEGLAAIEGQLENLARLDLHVLQTLFAQSAADVSRLLTTASTADFARLFGASPQAQLAWIAQGGYRTVQLPLAPPAPAPQRAAGAGQQGPQAGAATAAAPPGPGQRRAAVQAAASDKLAGAGAARGSPAQQLNSAAQHWAAARIAANLSQAGAAAARGTAVLDAMRLPGAPDGGIFEGVRARVRSAVSAGPYQGADVVVERRAALGVISGSYTDQQGRLHAGAIGGAFSGQLSGTAEGAGPHAVRQMLASGSGSASAHLQAHTEAGHTLAGRLDGSIALANAYLTLSTGSAQFEGRGALHAPMDGVLYRPDSEWNTGADPGGAARLRANPGRQLLTDGAGNRAVLQGAPIDQALHGDGAGQALGAHLHGTSNGWQHPVRNGQRYSDLKVTLHEAQRKQAGVFHPDTLQQIVRHAGSAGLARDYVRADGASDGGPDRLHGALLAPELTIDGTLAQLVAAGQLSQAAAALAAARLAVGTPVLKPDSKAQDIQYAATLQAGASYALTSAGKRYEFKLDALALPASWSDGRFRLPFRLAHQALAHYAAAA